jgi:hypothetical protein
MKILKISLAATIASILAWRLRLPHRIWPAHPQLADLVMTLIIYVALQFAWSDPQADARTKDRNPDHDKTIKAKSNSRISF